MTERNESSSLIALRGLREMEKQRLADEARARAEAEEARRADERAAAERLARAEAERAATRAAEIAAEEHLRRELGAAQEELEHLRVRLASAQAVVAPAPAPVVIKARPTGWMAACAATSMLAGLLAVQWATERPAPPAPVANLCPVTPAPPPPVAAALAPAPVPAPAFAPAPRPQIRRPHRPEVSGTDKRPDPGPQCDGTDPLCGIDTQGLDGTPNPHRKRPR